MSQYVVTTVGVWCLRQYCKFAFCFSRKKRRGAFAELAPP